MEVCNFRDNYSKIKKYNSNIVGISSDSVKSHNKFSKIPLDHLLKNAWATAVLGL